MKRNILVGIETDDTGKYCSVDCLFLVGYTCDCFLRKVGPDRGRIPECISAEIISKHKQAAVAGGNNAHTNSAEG